MCESTCEHGRNVDNKQIRNIVVLTFKPPNIHFLQYTEKQTANIWITFAPESVVVIIHAQH